MQAMFCPIDAHKQLICKTGARVDILYRADTFVCLANGDCDSPRSGMHKTRCRSLLQYWWRLACRRLCLSTPACVRHVHKRMTTCY